MCIKLHDRNTTEHSTPRPPFSHKHTIAMVVISRAISLVLRAGQLISAVIVAGIVGHYLAVLDDAGLYPGSRFIYTEVVAGLAIFTSLILLLPFVWAMTPLPWDFGMFILWVRARWREETNTDMQTR